MLPARRLNVSLGQDTRYVFLGTDTAPVSDPTRWIRTKTRKGDTLATLAAYYKTTAKIICQKNGIAFGNDPINMWVASIGGTCQNKVAGQPVVKGCSSGGWATFNDNTEILLPDIPRAGVNPPPGVPAPPAPPKVPSITVPTPGLSTMTMVGIFAAGTLGIVLWHKVRTRKAKEAANKKKPSPSPVALAA